MHLGNLETWMHFILIGHRLNWIGIMRDGIADLSGVYQIYVEYLVERSISQGKSTSVTFL
jgi:hypothetical protein